jgi:hypothetical protein
LEIALITYSAEFRGIQVPRDPVDDAYVGQLYRAAHGGISMHDLLIALAFIGIVIAPAIVAARCGPQSSGEEN